jgi:hypothetical protein
MQEMMPSPHPLWETALERYFAFLEKNDLTPDYRHEQRRLLLQIREAFPSTRTPWDLHEEQLLQFFLELKTLRGLATESRKKYAIALRGFLEYTGSPALRSIPKFPKGPDSDEGRYLGADDRARLWGACLDPEQELIVALGLGAGWRRSDVLGCLMTDFHPSAEAPQTVTLHGKGEKFYEVTLDLHPKIKEIMPRYLAWRAGRLASASAMNHLPPAEPPTLMIAISKHKGIGSMSESTFDNRINEVYKRAGVESGGWPSHNLRRTWAENRLSAVSQDLAERGENPVMALEFALRIVSREGRWKDIETLRRYLRRRMAASVTSLARTAI